LEQLRQVAEKTAFPQVGPASADTETPSNEYRPHRRYRIAKWLCWAAVVSILLLFLFQRPSRFAIEGRVVPVETRRIAAPFNGQFNMSAGIAVGSVVAEGELLGRVENWALNDELARTQIDRLVARLARQELRSPMDGVVLDAWKEAHESSVQEGAQLFRIGSRQNRIELRVRDKLLGADLKVRGEVVFKLAMMHHKFRGVIVKVNPLVHESEVVPARTIEHFCTILVDSLDPLPADALPGMHVEARLVGAKPRIADWWGAIKAQLP
jgi:hypothetical protein